MQVRSALGQSLVPNGHWHPSPIDGFSWFGQLSWLDLWTIPWQWSHGEVSSASQQTAWLGLWTTHHGNSAWTLLCLQGGKAYPLAELSFSGPNHWFPIWPAPFQSCGRCHLGHLWWLWPLQSLFGRQPWLSIGTNECFGWASMKHAQTCQWSKDDGKPWSFETQLANVKLHWW